MAQPTAYICFPDAAYTHSAAVKAAKDRLKGWEVIDALSDAQAQGTATPNAAPVLTSLSRSLYFCDYDLLPFEHLLGCPTSQCSSYVIRKALIRKNHLSHALHAFSLKQNSTTSAISITPRTWNVDLQFADELDELLLDDLYDLEQELRDNEDRQGERRRYFILKPAMADRGNGIRLFSSVEELRDIFEEFEDDSDDESDDNADEEEENASHPSSTAVMTSQLRHFVIQDYISTPLLLSPPPPSPDPSSSSSSDGPRKFHLRAYVLCVGGLEVYLYDEMLALFAPLSYREPNADQEDESSTTPDLRRHLTNTCLHSSGTGPSEENVHLWSDLANTPCSSGGLSTAPHASLTQEDIDNVKGSCASVVGLAFEAAAKGGTVHWQMWPNAFEIFGVDLMVAWTEAAPGSEPELNVSLLEVNAQPDFAQTGKRLRSIIDGLFSRTLEVAVLRQLRDEKESGGEEARAGGGNERWKVGESRGKITLCFAEELSKAW